MAKKKIKKNEVDNDLDFDELGDLELDEVDFGRMGEIDGSREPGKAGIAKDLAKESSAGFFDGLIKQTAKKALPEEYHDNYYEVMDYADTAKDIYDKNRNKISKSVYRFGKEVKKILPFQSNLLDKYLENYEQENEEYRAQSEESLREGTVNASLSGIFDRQLEVQKALEVKRQASDEVEAKERIYNNKQNLDLLTSIDSSTSNLTAFTVQISKEYYRKSLELQFKSYFVQADMLKIMRDHYKGFSLQLDNVIKNTGLPEYVKINSTERIGDLIKTQAAQAAYKKMYSNSEYIKNVKTKASKFVDNAISSVTDKLDTVTDQLGMLTSTTEGSSGALSLLGNVGANLLGTMFGEKIGDKVSNKIGDTFKNNKHIKAGGNYLSMLSTSPSTLFGIAKDAVDRKKEEAERTEGPMAAISSKLFGGLSSLLGVTAPGKLNHVVEDPSILDHNKAAIFDNNVHRSITEVIPMYLSRILKENADFTQAYLKINAPKLPQLQRQEALVYDYSDRKLTTAKEFVNNTEMKVLESNQNKNNISSLSNSILDNAKKNFTANPKAKKADMDLVSFKESASKLNKYLTGASKDKSVEFDFDTVIANYDKNDSLKAMVDNDPALKKLLETIKRAKVTTKNNRIADKMSDIQEVYPISTLKKVLGEISKLANRRAKNVIKDKAARILSKGLISFITTSNHDITPEIVSTGRCFTVIPRDDYPEVAKNITAFMSEVRGILNQNDVDTVSAMAALFGLLNHSLKDRIELNPEVFSTLRQYSPVLGKAGKIGGKLTVENLVEGKLFRSDEAATVSIGEIRKAVKTPRNEVEAQKLEGVKSELMNTLGQYTKAGKAFKEDLTNAGGDIFAIRRAVIKNAAAIGGLVKESGSKIRGSAIKSLSRVRNQLEKCGDNLTKATVDALISNLSGAILEVNEMVKKEETGKLEEIKALTEARIELEKSLNDPSGLSEIDRDIVKIGKSYDSSIKTMQKLAESLTKHRNTLVVISRNAADPNNNVKLIQLVRNEIASAMTSLKKIIGEDVRALSAEQAPVVRKRGASKPASPASTSSSQPESENRPPIPVKSGVSYTNQQLAEFAAADNAKREAAAKAKKEAEAAAKANRKPAVINKKRVHIRRDKPE